jgi:hypothetical protein
MTTYCKRRRAEFVRGGIEGELGKGGKNAAHLSSGTDLSIRFSGHDLLSSGRDLWSLATRGSERRVSM